VPATSASSSVGARGHRRRRCSANQVKLSRVQPLDIQPFEAVEVTVE
jgi:hypothetical protein